MLKAVILAGGRGKRLRPLTNNIPKPMIEIKGKPFLQHQLELLKKNGISEMILCVGYLSNKIMDCFGDGSGFGISIKYSIENAFLGTGGALKIAGGRLPNDFILAYGDSYLPIDYAELVNFWSRCDCTGLVVCYDNKEKIAKNNVYLGEDGFIEKYDKRNPDENMNYVEAGVTILNKKVLDVMPDRKTVSLEEEVFPILIRERKLMGYPTSQRYYDIGTPERLHAIEQVLR